MSAAPLKEFVSELRNRNIARPSQFHVIINPPPGLRMDTKLVNMWCHGANTPHSMIHTNDNYIEAGVRRKYAYDQDTANLVLQFYIDGNYETKQFFDEWKDLAFGKNRKFNYPDQYTSESIIINLLDQTNKDVYVYTYYNIYPKTISSVDLNYASGTQIASFTVEFVFENYIHSVISSAANNSSRFKPQPKEKFNNIEYDQITEATDQLGNRII